MIYLKKKNKMNKAKLLKGEKSMYMILLGIIISIPVLNVFTSSMLSESSTKVEKLKIKIRNQKVINEGLSMQIDELASLDNIKIVAEQYGLSYINGNIKTVSDK